MHGWTGKVLIVDLSNGTHMVQRPEKTLYETCIGGRGLAGHYFFDRAGLAFDDPDMPLLFFTGPLTGTSSPAPGRMTVMSRSPLTGTVCDASVGGRLGTRIKRAGWDGIIITGRAPSWCALEVRDDVVRIVDAEALRGAKTSEIAFGGDTSTAVIGPAAENGVRFAGIVVDGHYCAGRGGLGMVMAAKRLKYLSVTGSGSVSVFDRDEIARAREEIDRLVAASPALRGELGIGEFGTGALYDLMHARRMMPTDNFRRTRFSAAGDMNAYRYRTRYDTSKTGCAGCAILCKKSSERGIIPEFETMSHFSALILNEDIDAIMEANRICNETGMDTISAASTIACWQEIEGTRLSPPEMLALLEDIAFSRNLGSELKHGSRRYSVAKGQPETSMSVKGLELPAYDPRGAYGMALAYTTSTRGGCHLRGYPVAHEILRKPVATDRFSFEGKARIVKIAEDMNAAVDSLTACKFLFFAASLEEFSRALNGATGVRTSAQDLLRAGERIYYRERVMNSRNGFSSAEDDLPGRFFLEPGTGGDGIDIRPIDRAVFLRARADYYRIRGLDPDGMPLPQKCSELGI